MHQQTLEAAHPEDKETREDREDPGELEEEAAAAAAVVEMEEETEETEEEEEELEGETVTMAAEKEDRVDTVAEVTAVEKQEDRTETTEEVVEEMEEVVQGTEEEVQGTEEEVEEEETVTVTVAAKATTRALKPPWPIRKLRRPSLLGGGALRSQERTRSFTRASRVGHMRDPLTQRCTVPFQSDEKKRISTFYSTVFQFAFLFGL